MTWTYGVGKGIDFGMRNWLRDGLSTVLPSSRIIVYQCADLRRDLGRRNANGIIQDLMENRRACNRSQNPIIFLGMMHGGTFIKQLLISALRSHQEVVRSFGRCVRGIAFFGTPQNAQAQSPLQKSLLPPLLLLGLFGFMSDVRMVRSMDKAVPLINHDFDALRPDDLRCVCFYDTANAVEVKTNKDLGAVSTVCACENISPLTWNIKASYWSFDRDIPVRHRREYPTAYGLLSNAEVQVSRRSESGCRS